MKNLGSPSYTFLRSTFKLSSVLALFAFSHICLAKKEFKNFSGNQLIESFSKAKKHMQEVYKGMEETFYCGCQFIDKVVNYNGCAFVPKNPKNKRAKRIEWEHIVPAQHFGQSFVEWREGSKNCVTKKKDSFKGRNCARKVSKKFRLMESDLYNLVPVIGAINNRRGSLPIGLKGLDSNKLQGTCKTYVTKKNIEPRDKIKGFVARVYLYMDRAYPGHGILSDKNSKIVHAWNRQFPPDEKEKLRAQRIAMIQKNENPLIPRN